MKLCQLQRSKVLLERLIAAQLVNKLPTADAIQLFTHFQEDGALGSTATSLRTVSLTYDKDAQVHILLSLCTRFFNEFLIYPMHATCLFHILLYSVIILKYLVV
jgi:hypothetical protein